MIINFSRGSLTAVLLFGLGSWPALAGIPAFPGAAGFGAQATGGRGGAVVHVTNLGDRGAGSLRAALEQGGPRIVVFDVGGIVRLSDEIRAKGDLTVLGQTAPGDGITVTGARIAVVGSNAVIRGLHLRPGRGAGQDKDARDGLSVGAESGIVSRVIVDGNSASWATDEVMSTWYRVSDITFSNNIIAEGLLKAGHSEKRHSMGMLIGESSDRVSVLRNLFVSNFWRNPQIEQTGGTEVINNVMVNYGPGGILVSQGPSRVDIIGNVLIAGKDTPDVGGRPAIELKADAAGTAYYVSDNRTPLGADAVHGAGTGYRVEARVVAGGDARRPLPSGKVVQVVTATAGARGQGLDPVDRRVIDRALAGKAEVISKDWNRIDWRPAEVLRPEAADRDGDGIPDRAEAAVGSDAAVADSDRIDPVSGYAFIEVYANALLDRALP